MSFFQVLMHYIGTILYYDISIALTAKIPIAGWKKIFCWHIPQFFSWKKLVLVYKNIAIVVLWKKPCLYSLSPCMLWAYILFMA